MQIEIHKIDATCPECHNPKTLRIPATMQLRDILEHKCQKCSTEYGVRISDELPIQVDYFYMRSVSKNLKKITAVDPSIYEGA